MGTSLAGGQHVDAGARLICFQAVMSEPAFDSDRNIELIRQRVINILFEKQINNLFIFWCEIQQKQESTNHG